MIAAILAALTLGAEPPEPLPVDERMAAYERALPTLRAMQAEIDAETDRVGPPEPGWSTSGSTTAAAIIAGNGTPDRHVLQRQHDTRPSVLVAGDNALAVPSSYRRYAVRSYTGPVDYHSYSRLAPGIILHRFGASQRIGNADCRRTQGLEVLSSMEWRAWSGEHAFTAFTMAEWSRDDPRTYCMLFRSARNAGVTEEAFTIEGRPFLPGEGPPPTFVITSRDAAARRLFALTEGNVDGD